MNERAIVRVIESSMDISFYGADRGYVFFSFLFFFTINTLELLFTIKKQKMLSHYD